MRRWPHSIAAILDDELAIAPSVTTIWRILTRAGAITAEPRKRPKRSSIRFAADLPNECWQADFTHIRLADGTDTEVLIFLDDHSRYLISVTAHPESPATSWSRPSRGACTLHGIPQSTLTDNGFVFTTRFRGSPNRFEVLLAKLGVTQRTAARTTPRPRAKSND